jgi:hypothetical protein
MTITITLRDEVENLLREKAAQRGVTLDSLAADILDRVLSEENLEAAIATIRLSLQDYDSGNFRDFEDFVQAQAEKYGLVLD